MGDLIQELRFGVRALGKTPGMTAAAIVAFALGIGANAAIFSVVDAVLLRPLGYSDPARLVVLEHAGPSPVAPATYFDWRAQARSFTDMGAAQAWGGSLRTEEREILITSAIDTIPQMREPVPDPTPWPFVAAIATAIVLIASIYTPKAIQWGALPFALIYIGWLYPRKIQAPQPEET